MFKTFFKKGIHNLYLNHLLRGIAFSLFGIFVPIYLLTLGYSLTSIFVYFLIFQIVTTISFFIVLPISKKIGHKAAIIASTPLSIIFVLLFQILPSTNIPISIIAIVIGIQDGFYFLPLHRYFSKTSKHGKKGTQFSNYVVFGQISGLLGPLIGAGVATIFGFKYLFMVVLVFMLISIIPLLKLPNIFPKEKVTLKKLKNLTKKNKGFFLGSILESIKGDTESIVWTIFVFLILQDIISVGGIKFLITAGTMLFTLFIGRHYDKKNKYLFLRLGAILYAVLWILRAIIDTPIFIFSSSLLAGFLGLMISVPFISMFYEKTERERNQESFIIFREIPLFIGRITILTVMLIFVDKLYIGFIFASISMLIFSFLKFGVYSKKGYGK